MGSILFTPLIRLRSMTYGNNFNTTHDCFTSKSVYQTALKILTKNGKSISALM